jgi:hypothetical protein
MQPVDRRKCGTSCMHAPPSTSLGQAGTSQVICLHARCSASVSRWLRRLTYDCRQKGSAHAFGCETLISPTGRGFP